MRVFVALPLPDEVISRMALWLEPLRREHPGLRWVKPEQIHLTLRFLGDVSQGAVNSAAAILHAFEGGPLDFTLDRSGIFPGRGPEGLPSVYWIGGEWSPALRAVAEDLAGVRDDRGNTGSMGRFHPHLTIARQGRYNEKVRIPDPGPWRGTIDRAVVFNSTLTGSGPEYSELHSFRLSR